MIDLLVSHTELKSSNRNERLITMISTMLCHGLLLSWHIWNMSSARSTRVHLA